MSFNLFLICSVFLEKFALSVFFRALEVVYEVRSSELQLVIST
jgi:hypothetical protein